MQVADRYRDDLLVLAYKLQTKRETIQPILALNKKKKRLLNKNSHSTSS